MSDEHQPDPFALALVRLLPKAIASAEWQRSQIFDDAPELDRWLTDARGVLQRARVNVEAIK